MSLFSKRFFEHPKLTLFIIWLLAVLIVQPIGDFPLNDDWYYAYSVKQLLKGNWVILDYVKLNLYGQMIWGYLFCSIFGYSYTVLRISVLILSLITLFGIYHLLWENIKNKHWALFGSILFFFNPLFFSLSFTFMTDVPFLAVCIWALVYFLKAINSNKPTYFALVLAGTLSLVAVYIRQMGIFLPIAFLAFCLMNKRWNFQAFLPLLITIGGMWLLSALQGNMHSDQGKISELFNAISTLEKTKNTLWRTLVRLGAVFLYSGLFFFPLMIFLIKPISKAASVMSKKNLAIIGLPLTTFLLISVGKFPQGNIFYNWGLGPKTLKDYYIWKLNDFTEVAPIFWVSIKILAFIGSFLLILYLISTAKDIVNNKKLYHRVQFLVLACGVYVAFLGVFSLFFDRYTLPVMMLILLGILIIIVENIPFKYSKTVLLPFILLIAFSVLSTKDYLNWNRTRWQAIEYLKEQNITFKEIDAGYEACNDWLKGKDPSPYHDCVNVFFNKDITDSHKNLKYLIAFGEVDGYKTIHQMKYQRFIPLKKETIFILEREISTNTD